jgi:hypothetical protein
MSSTADTLRRILTSRCVAACLAAGVAMLVGGIADASAARGGGRGYSGGRMAKSSVSGANRSMSRGGNRSSANRGSSGRASAGSMDRGGGNRGGMNAGNTGRASAGTRDVNRGNLDRGNINTGNANRGNINTGNVNTGNINRGNVNIGNDVNIDIDGGYGYGRPALGGGGYYHPIAAGAFIGAMAVTTAAVMGSYYRTLPSSCTVIVKNGMTYHHCGSVYYQQTWSGNDVVYVVTQP